MSQDNPERVVLVKELRARTGLSRSTLYAMMAAKPPLLERPNPISPGKVGWKDSYITKWLNDRLDGVAA